MRRSVERKLYVYAAVSLLATIAGAVLVWYYLPNGAAAFVTGHYVLVVVPRSVAAWFTSYGLYTRKRDTTFEHYPKLVRVAWYLALGHGLQYDLMFNLTASRVIFGEWPNLRAGEWLFTDFVQRRLDELPETDPRRSPQDKFRGQLRETIRYGLLLNDLHDGHVDGPDWALRDLKLKDL